ncbi:lipoyl(octanoyl) transferase LipB [Rhodopila sp.]|uniref:lipoyl(octanoyl) transferase LipB n=1 Tax=Rhodopila sp. TaxID=2480087 RepID=UPI0038D0283B
MTSMTVTSKRQEWRIEAGFLPYPDAINLMRTRVAAIRDGTADELVWLVQHPPVYTAGTSARPEELVDPGRFPVFDAGRGGQWTYHGPGQRVAYVMLDLNRPHGRVPVHDIRCYVNGLEEWLIRTLRHFNVHGERREGRVGIWVVNPATGQDEKIAAIGVRVTRWVSWHGVALNVDPNLAHFGGIVPCGLGQYGVTSLTALGVCASMQDVDNVLRAAWQDVFVDEGPSCAATGSGR